jgi:hypothetical protein
LQQHTQPHLARLICPEYVYRSGCTLSVSVSVYAYVYVFLCVCLWHVFWPHGKDPAAPWLLPCAMCNHTSLCLPLYPSAHVFWANVVERAVSLRGRGRHPLGAGRDCWGALWTTHVLASAGNGWHMGILTRQYTRHYNICQTPSRHGGSCQEHTAPWPWWGVKPFLGCLLMVGCARRPGRACLHSWVVVVVVVVVVWVGLLASPYMRLHVACCYAVCGVSILVCVWVCVAALGATDGAGGGGRAMLPGH